MAQRTGAIYHQGILYSGGSGTNVTPNPQGEATDTLNTVEIDGTVYGIEGGGGSSLILDAQKYSLEEQVVGIWTDGKPLYQKTVHLSTLPSTANTYTTYPHGIQNIDTICGWDSVARWNTGTIRRIPSTQYVNNSQNIVGCFDVNITKTGIEIWVGQNRTALNSDFTIWYTKTTDTAGSGGYQAYGFSPIIYSDVEREVGVWRDNKPLYQRTFATTSPSAIDTTTSVITMPTGIETIVGLKGFINQSGAIAQENVNFYAWYRKSQNDIACRVTNQNWVSSPLFITVQYTKTTDVAGSGEYNTLAIPNVHYSTDEQVIGTWFGETLYQKTCTTPLTLNTESGEKTYTLDVSDVAKIISAEYSLGEPHYFINATRTSSNDEIRTRIGDGNQLRVWSGYDRSTKTVYTTLQYTKTTN